MKACEKLKEKVRSLDYEAKAIQEWCGKSLRACVELADDVVFLDERLNSAIAEISHSSIRPIRSLMKTHPALVEAVIAEVQQLEEPSGAKIKAIVEEAKGKDPNIPIQLRLFNSWNFSEALHGKPDYEWGYNTGHITENLLYYYTEPGDLVIDPMVGSGTTIGACERMERRHYTADKEENILNGIFPPDNEKGQLVFLDPPFYNLLLDEYKDYEAFRDFIETIIYEAVDVLKVGGYLALIMKNLCEAKDDPKRPMVGDCYKWLSEHPDLKFENMILCPLSTQRSGTDKPRERKELLNNARVVWVFKKVE